MNRRAFLKTASVLAAASALALAASATHAQPAPVAFDAEGVSKRPMPLIQDAANPATANMVRVSQQRAVLGEGFNQLSGEDAIRTRETGFDAEFKVGEHHRVMVSSVTEGEDKPVKYPLMFRACELVVVNKIDLPTADVERVKKEIEAVIGIEVHCQLKTASKMFCGCELSFGDEPNVHTCPVCLAHPGVLPVPNEEAIRRALEALGLLERLASEHRQSRPLDRHACHSARHRRRSQFLELRPGGRSTGC